VFWANWEKGHAMDVVRTALSRPGNTGGREVVWTLCTGMKKGKGDLIHNSRH
jgi:hypothetical protein